MVNPHQLLIKFSACYADEFDIEGFIVMTENEWKAHKVMVKDHFEKKKLAPLADPSGSPDSYTNRTARQTEVYFGTNESMRYKDYKDYMRCFKVIELSQQGYDTLKELFNVHSKGHSYKYAGKTHVIPTTDVIKHGMLAMIDTKEDE